MQVHSHLYLTPSAVSTFSADSTVHLQSQTQSAQFLPTHVQTHSNSLLPSGNFIVQVIFLVQDPSSDFSQHTSGKKLKNKIIFKIFQENYDMTL